MQQWHLTAYLKLEFERIFSAEEERRLTELRAYEQQMADQREKERREAAEREEQRRREGWRSRELLEQLARERDEKANWEVEKRRLLAEREAQERKRQELTSKETLERLTRKPYYSRENLLDIGGGGTGPTAADVTTKVRYWISITFNCHCDAFVVVFCCM